MSSPGWWVEITVDREREALRALLNAVARLARRPGSAPVPAAHAANPPPAASKTATGADTADALERFAHELQASAAYVDAQSRQNEDAPETDDATGRRAGGERRARERRARVRRAHERSVGVARLGDLWTAGASGATVESSSPAAADRTPIKAARYLATLAAAYGPLVPGPGTAAADADADADAHADAERRIVDVLVLDASALMALARGNARARGHLSRAVGALSRVVVPATALVDAAHLRVAEAVGDILTLDDATSRLAATLMTDTGLTLPAIALAVACAAHPAHAGRVAIVTADGAHATVLARATNRYELYVFAV